MTGRHTVTVAIIPANLPDGNDSAARLKNKPSNVTLSAVRATLHRAFKRGEKPSEQACIGIWAQLDRIATGRNRAIRSGGDPGAARVVGNDFGEASKYGRLFCQHATSVAHFYLQQAEEEEGGDPSIKGASSNRIMEQTIRDAINAVAIALPIVPVQKRLPPSWHLVAGDIEMQVKCYLRYFDRRDRLTLRADGPLVYAMCEFIDLVGYGRHSASAVTDALKRLPRKLRPRIAFKTFVSREG